MKSETIYQIILSVLEDEATDDEKSVLNKWLAESDQNKEEFRKIKQLRDSLNRKRKEKKFNVDKAWILLSRQTVGKKGKIGLKPLLKYAAVGILLIAFSYSLTILSDEDKKSEHKQFLTKSYDDVDQPTLLLENGEEIVLNEHSFTKEYEHVLIKNEANNQLLYETEEATNRNKAETNHLIIPHGKTYQVVLSDGTKVWLNSESRLIYPTVFTGKTREVCLTGEAYLEVSHNKEHPFIVRTKSLDVKVLGTSFNISCYEDEPEIVTTLIKGSVSIQTEKNKETIISPHEQFRVNTMDNTFSRSTVNTDIYTSWIKGIYIFRDTSLDEIIKKLQRWHDFTVSYEDDKLKNNRYSFEADRETDIDNILEVITYTHDISLERVNKSINIKKKRRE